MFDSFASLYGWTYREAFGWKFALINLVYSAYALSIALGLFFIASIIKKFDEGFTGSYSVVDTENNSEERVNNCSYTQQRWLNKLSGKQSLIVKFFNLLGILASWYALLSAVFAASVLSGLWVIPVWASMLIILFLFSIKFAFMIDYYSPNFLSKNPRQEKDWSKTLWRRIVITMSMNKLIFSLFMVFAMTLSIAFPLITADTCLDHFNYGYGEEWHGLGISTRFSRYLQIDTVCPHGQICQLYATLPEDGATAVIMNVHTGTDIKSITLGYDILENLDQDKVQAGIHQKLSNKKVSKSYYVDLETRGARYVHSVFLSGLIPNTNYYFEVYYGHKTDKAHANGTYLTLPSEKLERNIILASGGDVGTTLVARQMTASLGNFSIDAIVVGGDLAYDNGIKSCYYSWDLFLNMFKPVNEKLGRIVPLMMTIGNHDIGFNAFQDGNVDVTNNIYYTYFPPHSKYDKDGNILNEVPDIDERLSYNYHLVGNTVQLNLDSAYKASYDGPQKDFIKQISEEFPDRIKMANFHVPMYPTCFNAVYDDLRTIVQPRKHWAPLFRKYKFASAFENHYHLYKVSFPLDGNGNRDEEGGVFYFGDGNWGINPDGCYPNDANGNKTGELYNFGNTTHVWLINITKDTVVHYAINMTGDRFDREYAIKTSDYVTLDYDL